jgi:uncharacterized protein (DUF362 family)
MATRFLMGKTRPFVVLSTLVAVLIIADVYQARTASVGRSKFVPAAIFEKEPAAPVDGLTGATPVKVAIARSDDPTLAAPAALGAPLTYAQVEELVHRAVMLAGGWGELIHPGDRVLIKPNIVSNELSRLTDIRVIKAAVRLVHEHTGGDVEIVIGEGSAFPTSPEMQYTTHFDEAPWRGIPSGEPVWKELWDDAGYQLLLQDPDLQGIDFRLANLNGPREDLVEVDIPGGGFADGNGGKVWVHKEVLNADVHITVPSMKLHGFTGITVAMKNHIGLYPGTRYGFPKKWGVPQEDFRTKLLHVADLPRFWVDEEIVDMVLVGGVDFAIIDAVVANGTTRRNTILAGYDIVAVDHVAARLMGMNPDDIEHLTLGENAGLGTNDPARIKVEGSTIEENIHPFDKDSYFPIDYGQSNRTWLLRGPFTATEVETPIEYPFLPDEAETYPHPGEDGWSEATYFFDDRIDLGAFFNTVVNEPVVGYAFTCFDAPRDQEAHLWLGSDEDLRIYLNGELVSDYRGYRTFKEDQLVKQKVPIAVRQGENTLLVKVYHELSRFDFSLNVCEPETNLRRDGNRIFGLEFRIPEGAATAVEEAAVSRPSSFALAPNYPNPFNANTVIPYVLEATGGVRLEIFDVRGQRIRTLVDRPAEPGNYWAVWDGRDAAGQPVASGVYLYQLNAGSRKEARKLLRLR